MQVKTIWIGRWLIAVAALHTVVGCIEGGPTLLGMLRDGLYKTAQSDPGNMLISWFMLSGFMLALLGMAVHAMEKTGAMHAARPLGIGALMLSVLGVVLMPVSGFWLAFPPAFAMMRGRAA